MNKNIIAISILAVCAMSLILGIFKHNTVQPTISQPTLQMNQTVNKTFSPAELAGNKIALINIEGAISSDTNLSPFYTGFSAENVINTMEKIANDYTVKAVIIRINSPGGTVAASQDIYDAIIRLRNKKPVVVSMADVAASGGYYIASAADRIVAQKGTMTGSIGVIFNFVDGAKLAEKIGINSNVIKSGKFKDSGSMYRSMTKDEYALFNSSVMNAYGQFIDAINNGRIKRSDSYAIPKRNLDMATLKKYADGRVFLGDEALKLGFIDATGSQYDAQVMASNMAGSKNILPIVNYGKTNNFMNMLMNMEGRFGNIFRNSLPFSITHGNTPLMVWE